jgi:anti-sigma regulatory factor (Ser/Thr protein kinase)
VAELPAIRDELRAGLAHGAAQQRDTADVVILLLDELLSNGLRHGHPPVIAEVRQTEREWVFEVSDQAGAAAPTPDPDRDRSKGGMGLLLVAGLASAYGWFTHGNRKSVWGAVALG